MHIIIGCIYRHPFQTRECFHEAIKSDLEFEMLNNEGCEVYITGDININFFPIQYQQPNIGNVDMLLSLGYITIIP